MTKKAHNRKTDNDAVCLEHGGSFDDNPGKAICKTCEDWLVQHNPEVKAQTGEQNDA